MDRLDVAQELVGQAARRALQRRDGIEHGRIDDRLHDVVRGSRHDRPREVDLAQAAP